MPLKIQFKTVLMMPDNSHAGCHALSHPFCLDVAIYIVCGKNLGALLGVMCCGQCTLATRPPRIKFHWPSKRIKD
jgi:hypothetical protein